MLPDLLGDKKHPADSSMLLVDDIDYDYQTGFFGSEGSSSQSQASTSLFSSLEPTTWDKEVITKSFAKRFPEGKLHRLRGLNASEHNLRYGVAGKHFLHIETHGFCVPMLNLCISQQPLSSTDFSHGRVNLESFVSGIALASGNRGLIVDDQMDTEGLLLAGEIANLDLQDADLVCLSSCQTALGQTLPGEGMFSAQRALQIAGAQTSLTTIWSVEVRSMRALTAQFYRAFFESDLSKAEALQQAQIMMLRQYNWDKNHSEDEANGKSRRNPPALWAGYILHGDWR